MHVLYFACADDVLLIDRLKTVLSNMISLAVSPFSDIGRSFNIDEYEFYFLNKTSLFPFGVMALLSLSQILSTYSVLLLLKAF